ncbi:MAG: ribose-phosphate diphosphokinase [Blastocatellia bacterium]|nr:ribose-phosphate diphosphokinase [Blastocatellia bacterium]
MAENDWLVFATETYEYLRLALCDHWGFPAGQIERKEFPDGEQYTRLISQVAGKDVVLVGGTVSDRDTLELYDIACATVKNGARTLTLLMPYFGYSTMERAVKPGEIVKAKCRARLFSAVPVARDGNRVALIDLHADGIAHYFEGNIRPVHLYAKPVILEAIHELAGHDFVLACTDAGRAKWVQSLANEIGVMPSFVFKHRIDGATTEVTAVSAHVEGKHVVIYDDMIRTGGTLINAAKAYAAAGSERISVVTTHAVLPGDSLARLQQTGLFEKIVCTDTHPQARALEGDFLHVRSIAGVLSDFLKAS